MDALQSTANLPSLEEQVARLQALLEATRRVHSTIAVDEVLLGSAQIVVRELEMEGALLISPETGNRLASYGDVPEPPFARCSRFALLAKGGAALAELLVRICEGCVLSFYEEDFIEGLVLQAAVALKKRFTRA